MTGVGKPLDDRPQALRHACGRIADAVIVRPAESARPSVPTGQDTRQHTESSTHQGVSHVAGTDHRNCRRRRSRLLQGPLKHVRAAALAAALVPLASVVATPASAQDLQCPSGRRLRLRLERREQQRHPGSGEPAIAGAVVTLGDAIDGDRCQRLLHVQIRRGWIRSCLSDCPCRSRPARSHRRPTSGSDRSTATASSDGPAPTAWRP